MENNNTHVCFVRVCVCVKKPSREGRIRLNNETNRRKAFFPVFPFVLWFFRPFVCSFISFHVVSHISHHWFFWQFFPFHVPSVPNKVKTKARKTKNQVPHWTLELLRPSLGGLALKSVRFPLPSTRWNLPRPRLPSTSLLVSFRPFLFIFLLFFKGKY